MSYIYICECDQETYDIMKIMNNSLEHLYDIKGNLWLGVEPDTSHLPDKHPRLLNHRGFLICHRSLVQVIHLFMSTAVANNIYIWYYICFDNRDKLPGHDDDDDTGDMSTCDMQPTADEVAEIFKQQVTL